MHRLIVQRYPMLDTCGEGGESDISSAIRTAAAPSARGTCDPAQEDCSTAHERHSPHQTVESALESIQWWMSGGRAMGNDALEKFVATRWASMADWIWRMAGWEATANRSEARGLEYVVVVATVVSVAASTNRTNQRLLITRPFDG